MAPYYVLMPAGVEFKASTAPKFPEGEEADALWLRLSAMLDKAER
jgi:hypothetical protein